MGHKKLEEVYIKVAKVGTGWVTKRFSKMDEALEVETMSREVIKPCFPTPHHLRNFKLSLMDQIKYSEYVVIVFLFSDPNIRPDQISQRLKSSLSETLTKFYPLAGRVKDDFTIDCNDDGAEYVEARANGFLSEYLQKPDQKLLRGFYPFNFAECPTAGEGPLLRVQATFFKCGGLAVASCTSHKLIDGMSLATFVNSWAATARDDKSSRNNKEMLPQYVLASIFPPSESFVTLADRLSPVGASRFVFHASKVDQLKAKVAGASVPRPTRVEALTALIWKCAWEASRSNLGIRRPSLLAQAKNVRPEVEPPLPNNSVGNCVVYLAAQTSEKELELQELVCLLRKAKQEFGKNGLQTLLKKRCIFDIPESIKDKFEKDEIDFYTFSSMVTFPFYQVDFGWGEPVHVTLPNYRIPNLVTFMATKNDDGIEALVTLSPQDMALFQRNSELLAFANHNPPVHAMQVERKTFRFL